MVFYFKLKQIGGSYNPLHGHIFKGEFPRASNYCDEAIYLMQSYKNMTRIHRIYPDFPIKYHKLFSYFKF